MGTLEYQNAEKARQEIVRTWRQKLFGLSRRDAWNALAAEVGARMENRGWLRGDCVVLDLSPSWQITLDIFMVDKIVFTRLRCPFVNPQGFRFTVYRKSIFSNLGKMLGMQDIEIGDHFFDDDFIIKSNDPPRVRKLLQNLHIRKLIEAQPRIRFEVIDKESWPAKRFPPGVDEMRFYVAGVIKDLDRLRRLFDLFAETLEELYRMGCADDSAPGVKLK